MLLQETLEWHLVLNVSLDFSAKIREETALDSESTLSDPNWYNKKQGILIQWFTGEEHFCKRTFLHICWSECIRKVTGFSLLANDLFLRCPWTHQIYCRRVIWYLIYIHEKKHDFRVKLKEIKTFFCWRQNMGVKKTTEKNPYETN